MVLSVLFPVVVLLFSAISQNIILQDILTVASGGSDSIFVATENLEGFFFRNIS